MNSWTESIARLLSWRSPMPKQLHLQGIFVHISLILALPLSAVAISLVPFFTSLDGEWGAAAITIPIVWTISLAVRILVQWLSIGTRTGFEFVVGPTGNLSHEFSQLSGPNMMTYAVAGQSVTLILAVVGVLVLGASPSSPTLTLASLLELQTGWHWSALASQLLWVNTFLFAMHMLPASPFDARALYVGWCHISHSGITPGSVHRSLATVDSHIGTAAARFFAGNDNHAHVGKPNVGRLAFLAHGVHLLAGD